MTGLQLPCSTPLFDLTPAPPPPADYPPMREFVGDNQEYGLACPYTSLFDMEVEAFSCEFWWPQQGDNTRWLVV